jgi:geranylgeranyl diphosphate synthase type I
MTTTIPTSTPTVTDVRSAYQVLAWSRELVDPALRKAVGTLPGSIRRIAGYHFGWWEADGHPIRPGSRGGKAIRPALALLAAEAVGAEPAAALPAAVAVELVHNFSLIQDDVIDGDLTRRHRPTVWSVFGPGAAIVAGDALLTLAFDAISGSGHPAAGNPSAPMPSGAETTAARMLHNAVLDLIEGQHADISFEGRADVDLTECVTMAEGKSGALLGCACALGAWFGGATATHVARLRRFGAQLGVAFQLADDLLGIWGDPAVTGKPVHSDLHRRKKSLPLVAALTSGTPAGEELAMLYDRDRPLSDSDLVRAAELVDRAGGRAWSRRRSGDLLASALRQLRGGVGSGSGRAVAELRALARLAAYRDR